MTGEKAREFIFLEAVFDLVIVCEVKNVGWWGGSGKSWGAVGF